MEPVSIDSNLFRYSFTFFSDKKKHLRDLAFKKNRFKEFSRSGGGLYLDFSRQHIDKKSLELLLAMAKSKQILKKFKKMTNGEIVNTTENRPALHTLCRNTGNYPELQRELKRVYKDIKSYCEKVHSGEICGSTGKKFTKICVVGIGGSNLATEFVIKSLKNRKKYMDAGFIATCDPCEFINISREFDVETTLFIIISKSYTTREVMMNEDLIRRYLNTKKLDASKHIIRVTSKGSPGDTENSDINVFHMFDSIGGRYSVSSAVGGLPISLVYGIDVYAELLDGMKEMDSHALNSQPENNIPLISALIDIWNSVYMNYSTMALIPYCSLLEKLPYHIQQLYMESNGKRLSEKGFLSLDPTSMVIFGETGTKCQHSFFQLFHQGRAVPIEFIGVLEPPAQSLPLFDNISGHDELWANLLAQADSLARGRESEMPEKECPGNRPSSIITIENTDPVNIGRLLSFYEARTIFAGFLWGINPFDQFGVELGKNMACEKRGYISKSLQTGIPVDSKCDSTDFYLKALINRTL